MKNLKKIGLGIFFVAVFGTMLFSFQKHAYAYVGKTQAEQCRDSLHFTDIAHIECNIPGQPKPVVFYDKNPTDKSQQNYAYLGPTGIFCKAGVDILDGDNRSGNLKLKDAGSKIKVAFQAQYVETGKTGCKAFYDSVFIKDTENIAILLKGGSNKATSLDNVSQGALSGHNYTRFPSASPGSVDPNNGNVLFGEDVDLGSCSGSILVVDPSAPGKAVEYSIVKGGKAFGDSNNPNFNSFKSDTPCGTSTDLNFGLGGGSFLVAPSITNISQPAGSIVGHPCDPSATAPSGFSCSCETPRTCVYVANNTLPQTGNETIDSSCEASGFSLAWILCPVFLSASKTANYLVGLFEDQLSFTVSKDLGGANSGVKTAWSSFTRISTALLVVAMLLMVISQAVGGGPFEPYTVRKLLPKLVAAAIFMQISWYALAWGIDLVNDIGHGLAAIMAAPFGGEQNLSSLGRLLQHAGIDEKDAAGLNIVAMIGGAIVASIALPMATGMAFAAALAIATGLIVLVFRKILIIMLIILAPVALVAAVLPGTDQYWKLWYKNLIKVLMMFPLAIAIVMAGRIFAYLVGGLNHGSDGPFLAVLFVLIGFFGPLFILPKTFKWGGEAMQAAGNAGFKARDYLNKNAQEKYFKPRQEAWTTERRRQSQERVAGKTPYTKKTGWYRFPLDRFRSGSWDPLRGLPGNRNRFEARAGYEAAGRESAGKTFEAAKGSAQQLLDNAADHDAVARNLARGGEFDYIDKRGRQRRYKPPKGSGAFYMRAAGLTAIAKYGTDRSWRVFQAEIDRLRAEGGGAALMAEEVLDENVGVVKDKMDSMYRGFSLADYRRSIDGDRAAGRPIDYQKATRAARLSSIKSSIDSMKETWFNGMEGTEAVTLLAGLSQGIAAGDSEAVQKMQKLWKDYQAANNNPNITINPGVHKAFKAYADGNPDSKSGGRIDQINRDRDEEVMERYKGDIVHPDGTVEGVLTWRRARPHPVLDKIIRDNSNEDLIRDGGYAEYMERFFDGDGARKSEEAPAPPPAGGGRPPRGTGPVFEPSMDEGNMFDYQGSRPAAAAPAQATVAASAPTIVAGPTSGVIPIEHGAPEARTAEQIEHGAPEGSSSGGATATSVRNEEVTNITNNVTNVTQGSPPRDVRPEELGGSRAPDLSPLANTLAKELRGGLNEGFVNLGNKQGRKLDEGFRRLQNAPDTRPEEMVRDDGKPFGT